MGQQLSIQDQEYLRYRGITNTPVKSVPKGTTIPLTPGNNAPQPKSIGWGFYGAEYAGANYTVVGYDGEKNLGEVGPIKMYQIQHQSLLWRSRQLYIESEICAAVVDRGVMWEIGAGLKLQCQPKKQLLEMLGIKINAEEFSKRVEAFFSVYANSKMADYAGVLTLNQLKAEAARERKLCGDMLVVLRVIKGVVKVQHIDASLISNPLDLTLVENENTTGFDYMSKYGYRVRDGVEFDEKGQHIAYYVRVGAAGQHKRILARGPKSGMLMAYMIYGKKNGIDAKRGMPLLAKIIERAKMLDRYTGAALGAAEERQKIPYFFEHGVNSKQIDPQEGVRAKAYAGNASAEADIPVLSNGETKVTNVAISAEKTVYDLPNDVTVKAIDSKQEIDVPGFGTFNIELLCAGVNIPPQVAMSKYDGSFSSSRMSGKDWEHTFMTERADFSNQYLSPIYALQLYLLVLNNYVPAMGYIEAIESGNDIVVSAFTSCRWVGDKFPDIDPLKTANYLRKMLGDDLANAPLMTLEAAAEEGNQGDYSAIIEQVEREKKDVEKAGIAPVNHGGPSEQDSEDKKPPEDEGSGS